MSSLLEVARRREVGGSLEVHPAGAVAIVLTVRERERERERCLPRQSSFLSPRPSPGQPAPASPWRREQTDCRGCHRSRPRSASLRVWRRVRSIMVSVDILIYIIIIIIIVVIIIIIIMDPNLSSGPALFYSGTEFPEAVLSVAPVKRGDGDRTSLNLSWRVLVFR